MTLGVRCAAGCCVALIAAAGMARAADPPLASQPQGHRVFEQWCAACHAPESGNERLPGTSALQSIYHGAKPAALEQRSDLTAAVVAYYVRHGDDAMPWFRKTEISDADLAALGAYLSRNYRGGGSPPAGAPHP